MDLRLRGDDRVGMTNTLQSGIILCISLVKKVVLMSENSLYLTHFAVVIPLANEERDFQPFIDRLNSVIQHYPNGKVYFIVDLASHDNTLLLCRELSQKNTSFITIFAPENKNVVEAYQRGCKEALQEGYDYIIEMDGGLSHNPDDLPLFIEALTKGYDCAFGSRNIAGGSNTESPFKRRFLSKAGTVLANLFLNTKLHDMTSGFQGFNRQIVAKFVQYPWRSTAHFYQTEMRYLLRHQKQIEIPIRYRAPSPRVKFRYIINACHALLYYTAQRILRKDIYL